MRWRPDLESTGGRTCVIPCEMKHFIFVVMFILLHMCVPRLMVTVTVLEAMRRVRRDERGWTRVVVGSFCNILPGN